MGAVTFCLFVFSCDQAALWMVFSVRLSVCHTFLTMFPSSLLPMTRVKSMQNQGQRSNVKVTTQLNRFRTVTRAWIHIWWWNDACSLILLRIGALLFLRSSFKFQGHTALKIVELDPNSHWGHWWRRLQPTSSIITDAKSVDSNLVDFYRKTCMDQPGILHNDSS